MGSEIEAIGDIATGAAYARAVEPEAGEGKEASSETCLNCGVELHGAHCHTCGQKAKVHRTLAAFGHDILHSVLHFDGKIWRTLPLLILHPGKLTRRYVEGERAKFVSPIALFLFMVFLSFAVFGALLPKDVSLNMNKAVDPAQTVKELQRDRKELLTDIEELKKEKQQAIAEGDAPPSYSWIDREIERHQQTLKKLDVKDIPNAKKSEILDTRVMTEQRKLEAEVARSTAALANAKAAGRPTAKLANDLDSNQKALTVLRTAQDVVRKGSAETKVNINIAGIKSLEDAARHAIENPQLLLFKVQSNAYKFSWALIPISVPFVWLLFAWKRRFKMFDHAVFVTYSLCFMMALAAIGGVVIALSEEGSAPFVIAICALTFLPAIHMYRQVHHAYGTTRFGAIWRTAMLCMFAFTALSLFAALILILGLTR